MRLIKTVELSTAAIVEFSNIPQNFTDLVLIASSRNNVTANSVFITFNADTTSNALTVNFSGNGSAVSAQLQTNGRAFRSSSSSTTTGMFGSSELYLSRYSDNGWNKAYSVLSVWENTTGAAEQLIQQGRWPFNDAITYIKLTTASESQFATDTVISLYGIKSGSDGIVATSVA